MTDSRPLSASSRMPVPALLYRAAVTMSNIPYNECVGTNQQHQDKRGQPRGHEGDRPGPETEQDQQERQAPFPAMSTVLDGTENRRRADDQRIGHEQRDQYQQHDTRPEQGHDAEGNCSDAAQAYYSPRLKQRSVHFSFLFGITPPV
jgi:hypothetical protein